MTEQPVFSEQLIKALLPIKSRKIGNIRERYAQKSERDMHKTGMKLHFQKKYGYQRGHVYSFCDVDD